MSQFVNLSGNSINPLSNMCNSASLLNNMMVSLMYIIKTVKKRY